MTVDFTRETTIPHPPSVEDVLKRKVLFPFETFEIWAETFNHLRFEKAAKGKEPETQKNEDGSFTLTLPENPTLGQVLDVTKKFIKEADIKIDNPRFLTFSRDLRNMARLLAQLTKQSLLENEQQSIESLIVSLYHLGEGLEKVVKGEDYQKLTPNLTLDQLASDPWELPEGTDLQSYQDELFLAMLGKDQAFYDEKSLTDEKLSQVVEHSAYYYLFQRYAERKGKKQKPEEKTSTLEEQRKEFDQWLLNKKHFFVFFLAPRFLHPQRSPLKEGGRTETALWQTVLSSVFFHLDQAIEEEGWKKTKEKLLPPPFNLSPQLQTALKEIYAQNQTQTTTLFESAKKIIEKPGQEQASVYDKMTTLLELVWAYDHQKIYKLTAAVKNRAFECHLRSYILGRLYQELLGDQVDVYTVSPPNHTKLLVFDKTTNKGYWVQPTPFIKTEEGSRRVENAEDNPDFSTKEVTQKEWQEIQRQIKADPNNFSIFGRFDHKFMNISPFKKGIESGFWNNLFTIYYNKGEDEQDPQKKQEFFKKAFNCKVNALQLNPNHPGFHNNLAVLYTEKEFAEAINLSYKESLKKAFEHYQRAIEIYPYDPGSHNNLAFLYTKREFAENDEEYFNNFNFAFSKMHEAFNLNQSPIRYDKFFWVITKIPDDKAQEIFNHLTPQTKKIILEMYQGEMRSTYTPRFSSGFEKTAFWQIFTENCLNSPQTPPSQKAQ